MILSLYILIIILGLCVWRFLKFKKNYEEGKKIGFPYLLSPVDALDLPWLMTKDLITPMLQRLPFGLGDFSGRAYVGWNIPDYYGTHARMRSDAFTIVTPRELEVYIADADAADDVLTRRKDFIKSPAIYDLLNTFGPNVNTANGEVWQRHRRITAPPFNERNSELVWKEALRQSNEVLESWERAGKVTTTTLDTMTLALHVLTAAGFGEYHSFHGDANLKSRIESGHTMTFRDAMRVIIRNMVNVILLRAVHAMRLPKKLLSGKMRQVNQAVIEFEAYLKEMIMYERAAIASRSKDEFSPDKSNLMSVLLRSSEQAASKDPGTALSRSSPSNAGGLTDEEIHGNLFIYSLAGHDTTANTISYAIILLAVYPQWQEWLREEVDRLSTENGDANSKNWDYEKSFPKLQRCLVVMYETLRLYGPVVAIPRYTSYAHQPLTISGRTYIIPPKTNVFVNLAALHTHPSYWGSDPMLWRPDRWILTPPHSNVSSGATALFIPRAGAFYPWAGGPRICPGKKFSQVEFVAVIASMLRSHRVEAVRAEGETAEQARVRILKMVEHSRVEFTLKIQKPERIGLKWVRR